MKPRFLLLAGLLLLPALLADTVTGQAGSGGNASTATVNAGNGAASDGSGPVTGGGSGTGGSGTGGGPDTDGDGLPDDWEQPNGTDPEVADAEEDPDNDGLTNAEERAAGTYPQSPDSDGDQANDGVDGWALDEDLKPPRLPEVRYAVIDLSEAGAQAGDSPWKVNDRGVVVMSGNSQIKAWEAGASPSVETIPLDARSEVRGLDNEGYVYGIRPSGNHTVPWRWKRGGSLANLPDVATPPSATGRSYWVRAVSSGGTAIGAASFEFPPLTPPYDPIPSLIGVTWVNGATPTTVFGPDFEWEDATNFNPYYVNDQGRAVGTGGTPSNNFGNYWNGSAWSLLPSVPGAVFTNLNAINNGEHPVLAGASDMPYEGSPWHRYATMWVEKEGVWKVKTFEGRGGTVAGPSGAMEGDFSDLNDRMEAIGSFYSPGHQNLVGNFVRNGRFLDVKSLTAGWGDFQLFDINNHGLILATAKKLDQAGQTTGNALPVMLVPTKLQFKNPRMTGGDEWKDLDPADGGKKVHVGVMANSNNTITFRVDLGALQDAVQDPQVEWTGDVTGTGKTITHTFSSTGNFDFKVKINGGEVAKGSVWVNSVSGQNQQEWEDDITHLPYGLALQTAIDNVNAIFTGHNDVTDAEKHAYLSAIIQRDCNSAIAESVMNAHEMTNIQHGDPENESVMDLFNNKVGRENVYPLPIPSIIHDFPAPPYSDAAIKASVEFLAEQGKLIMLDGTPHTVNGQIQVDNPHGSALLTPSRGH